MKTASCRNDAKGTNIVFIFDTTIYNYFEIDTKERTCTQKTSNFLWKTPLNFVQRYARGLLIASDEGSGRLRLRNVHDEDKKKNFEVIVKYTSLACITENGDVHIRSGKKNVTTVIHLSRF